MRKLVLAFPVLAALALSGCQTTGGVTPANVNAVITQVQSTTRSICAFVPTAQTVAAILQALGVGGVSQVTDIASQICNAVAPKLSAKRRSSLPTVAGVTIQGYFVR